MELEAFVHRIGQMSAEELTDIAAAIGEHHDSAGDEIDAWRAVLHIDLVLRRNGLTRHGAQAAHRARRAVLDAAAEVGFPLPNAAVTRVARTAALVARGLVAGPQVEADVRWLLLEFQALERAG